MINAGELTSRILLLKPVKDRDAQASTSITYTAHTTVWVQHVSGSGREFYAAQKINPEVQSVYKLRYRTDLQNNWHIQHGNREFEILFMDDSRKRDGELLIACREVYG
jgi:SPP1 family predicted phage head-tail adaptor